MLSLISTNCRHPNRERRRLSAVCLRMEKGWLLGSFPSRASFLAVVITKRENDTCDVTVNKHDPHCDSTYTITIVHGGTLDVLATRTCFTSGLISGHFLLVTAQNHQPTSDAVGSVLFCSLSFFFFYFLYHIHKRTGHIHMGKVQNGMRNRYALLFRLDRCC